MLKGIVQWFGKLDRFLAESLMRCRVVAAHRTNQMSPVNQCVVTVDDRFGCSCRDVFSV